VLLAPIFKLLDPFEMVLLGEMLVYSASTCRASPTMERPRGRFLPISARVDIDVDYLALGAKALTLPVARSSKRTQWQ